MRRAIVFIAIFLVSCQQGESSRTIESTYQTCHENKDHFESIIAELKKRKIEFWITNETLDAWYMTCANSRELNQETMEEIEHTVFGEKPPVGLSISYSVGNEKAIALLEANGIEVSKHHYKGKEYISWKYHDYELAEELLEFSDELRAFRKEARMNAKSPLNKSSNPDADGAGS